MKYYYLLISLVAVTSLFADTIIYMDSDGSNVQFSLDLWNGGNFNDNTPPKVVNDPLTYTNNSGNKVIQTVSYFGLWDKGGSKTGVHCQLVKNKKKDNSFLFTQGSKRTIDFSFLIPSSTNPAAINYSVVDPIDGLTYSVQDNGGIRAIHQLIQNYYTSNWCPAIMFIAEPFRKKLYFRNVTMPFLGDMSLLTAVDPILEERDFELMDFEFDTWYTIRYQVILENGSAGRSKVYSIENGVKKQLPFKQVARDNHSTAINELINGVSQQWVRYELQGSTLFTEYFDIATHEKKSISNPSTNFSTENYAWFSSAIPSPNKRSAVTYHDNITIYEEIPSLHQAPIVAFLAPAAGDSLLAPASLMVVAQASDTDGSIANLRLYINNNLVRQENAAPYTWNDSLQNDLALQALSTGSYVLRLVATDDSGDTSEVMQNVTVVSAYSSSSTGTFSSSSVESEPPVANLHVRLNPYLQEVEIAFDWRGSRHPRVLSYRVVDINGLHVTSQNRQSALMGHTKVWIVDSSPLPSGLYIIEVWESGIPRATRVFSKF